MTFCIPTPSDTQTGGRGQSPSRPRHRHSLSSMELGPFITSSEGRWVPIQVQADTGWSSGSCLGATIQCSAMLMNAWSSRKTLDD